MNNTRAARRVRAAAESRAGRRGGNAFFSLLVTVTTLWIAGCAPVDLDDKFAIVYGVADYSGTANDLDYSDDDALALSEALIRQGWEVLQRYSVTLAQVEDDFDWARKRAQRNSRFLFYFSGHGGPGISVEESEPNPEDPYDEFIFVSDSTNIQALSDDELARYVDRVDVPLPIIIIDACYSGGFIGDSLAVDLIPADYEGDLESAPFSGLVDAFLNYFASPSDADIAIENATVITSCGAEELAFETNELGHGVFTYYLLRSPSFADANRDGSVTATETYWYISAEIEKKWNQAQSPYRISRYFLPHISGGPVDPVLFVSEKLSEHLPF